MNPFDQPPTEPPVSTEPPVPPSGAGHGGPDSPRRGRMALAALAAAGLVGGGIVVAGQFASADRPSLGATEVTDEPAGEEPATEEPQSEEPAIEPGEPSIDGEIVIDDGEGEPFVLDLGELGACLDPIFRGGPMFDPDLFDPDLFDPEGEWNGATPPLFDDDFHRRMEEFLETLPWDDLGELGIDEELFDDGVRIFGSGGSTVTVVGPEGVEVIDLGEGDATVTIEQRDGELSVATEGDATVDELDLGELDLGELDLGELDLGELDLGELDLGEWRDRMPFDLDEIESCLDDADGTD